MNMHPMPATLRRRIDTHGDTFAPRYPPVGNSDHGPMAYLALHGLGISLERIEEYAAYYQRRLVAYEPATQVIEEADWQRHIGQQASYAGLRGYFVSQIALLGPDAVLSKYLPTLISGWVMAAFHPIIRLGYGIEFSVESEIASGLAYLASTGVDPQLTCAAERSAFTGSARQYLQAMQAFRGSFVPQGSFGSRYGSALEAAGVHPLGGNAEEVLRSLGRSVLEVFDATHDFFALHLVTGSHAFRLCLPWLGSDAAAIYSTGIAAAYLAVGAPEFTALPMSSAEIPIRWLATEDDEHHIKIAYSSLMQAQAFQDPTYAWAAARYFAATRPALS
jgi:hypothetical protein